MAEEGTDTLIELGANDVFEAAGLIMRFRVVDSKGVFEEAFREAMPAHHAARALAADRCEERFPIL